MPNTMPPADVDTVLAILLREDIDAIRNRETQPATAIVDEEYEPGVPGRACLSCSSAWPASEPDGASWHHSMGCGATS